MDSSAEVFIPHLGGSVRVRGIPRKLLAVFVRQARRSNGRIDLTEFQARKLAYGLVKPNFTLEEVHQLLQRNGPSVFRVLKVIDDLSGTTDYNAPGLLGPTLRCASQIVGRSHHHRPRPGHAPRRRGCSGRRVRSGDSTSTRAGPGDEPPGDPDHDHLVVLGGRW